ncbi:MAG: hypothetical protein IKF38_01125 [Clostridia bacterium]|nr:hypothetical protein [Clostridia bacterium]
MLRVSPPFEYDKHDPSEVKKVSVLNENLNNKEVFEKRSEELKEKMWSQHNNTIRRKPRCRKERRF